MMALSETGSRRVTQPSVIRSRWLGEIEFGPELGTAVPRRIARV